jgi:elongation factor Tu
VTRADIVTMSAFSRSLTPLLRTGRYALQRQRGINPMVRVLAQDPYTARGMATAFQRTKPHVNIGEWSSWCCV